jgi:hypothetical protein
MGILAPHEFRMAEIVLCLFTFKRFKREDIILTTIINVLTTIINYCEQIITCTQPRSTAQRQTHTRRQIL